MLTDVFKNINWVDIFVIIILFRIGYIAINQGFRIEIFKLLGTISAIYVSLHYYVHFAVGIVKFAPIVEDVMSSEFLEFLSCIALAMITYLIFVLLRSLFYRLLKMEALPALNHWGGFVLGIARASLLAGLIIFILVASDVSYLKNSVKKSYSGPYLAKLAPATYSSLWNVFMSKFMTGEKFNKAAVELKKEDTGK